MIAAVLAVFLVAVLFMGSASAANPTAGSTVYVYQYNATNANSTYYLWESGQIASIITSDATGTISGESVVAGLYSSNGNTAVNLFTIKYPSLTLAIYKANSGISIANTTVLKSQSIDFSLTGIKNLNYSIKFTTPAGGSTYEFGENSTGSSLWWNSTTVKTLYDVSLASVSSGTWSAKASFATSNTENLLNITPSKYVDSNTVSFTVGSAVTDSISINKDSIIRGASILVTVTGTPSNSVLVTVNEAGFTLLDGQSYVHGNVNPSTGYLVNFTIDLSSSGTRTVQLNSDSGSDDTTYTFTTNQSPTQKAKVSVSEGIVSAVADQNSYYIGNDITLSGTNTETENIYLFIKGSNVERTYLSGITVTVDDDNTWTSTFNPVDAYGKSLDSGTYTFYASSAMNGTAFDSDYTYATISVSLKQPFLSATAASSTVAQGDDIVINGIAEATNDLRYYVFGTNKFVNGSISVDDEGTFSAEIDTTDLSAGQYFVVIQHKMYDGFYNILPIGTIIYQNPTATPVPGNANTSILFDTADRQSANAAEALCQALNTQNIDDIYVKLTFIVAQPTLTLNPVSDVTKGSALKVSGTANLKAGTLVTVDVLSTAFTAVDKSSVNSASFITLTTKVVAGADGANTWEVTFDTSGLNVDSYTIQAVTEDLTTSTIVKVIEATATATATKTAIVTATATATATQSNSPGFGAFLALAGLGAVAVLVLRRD